MFKHTVKFCKVHAETITEVFVGSTDFPEYTRERIKMLSTQNLFCLADNVKYFAGIGVFEWVLKEPWNDIVGLFKAGHVGFHGPESIKQLLVRYQTVSACPCMGKETAWQLGERQA